MAVTVEDLAMALRLSEDGEDLDLSTTGILTRLLGVGDSHVELLIPTAPDAIQDEVRIRLAAYLYDQPVGRRDAFANSWVNSGAGALAARWLTQRVAGGSPAPGGGGGGGDGLDTAAVNELIRVHQEIADAHFDHADTEHVDQDARDGIVTHNAAGDSHEDLRTAIDGRVTQDTVEETAQRLINAAGHTPTPPVVLVDGEAYTAHGDVTAAGWRGYDFIQLLYTNGANTYQTEPVNAAQLIALSPIVVSVARNVHWTLSTSDTDDDVITIASSPGNAVPAPSATSTMTIIAWFAGTVVEGGGGEGGDDAYDWATVGHDDELVPTDKINFAPGQLQIDEIVDQIAHSEGTLTAVVPTIGAGMDSLRYTLPADLDGLYDVSVRVKARVQVSQFANISGNLHIVEDGGNGLNAAIPEKTHNFHHAHEGVFNFIRKGLTIAPGVNQIDFTASVTGNNPPHVHFTDVENMTITDTSLGRSWQRRRNTRRQVDGGEALCPGFGGRNRHSHHAGPGAVYPSRS